MARRSRESTRERLKAYMLKSAREAKLRTSWINPDEAYEAALERFVAGTSRTASSSRTSTRPCGASRTSGCSSDSRRRW